MESAVEVAKKRLSGEDEEWNRRKDVMLESMCKLILQYKMEDPPHKAVAILSRMFTDAREIDAQKKLVQGFDEKRRRLHTLRAEEERRGQALREAKRMADEERQKWRAVS
jgi:hypothetical protein